MATLWIREYAQLAEAGDGDPMPLAREPGYNQPALTFSASTASAAFRRDTRYIAIYGSAAFHYEVGATPTAVTTASMKVPADTLLYLGVEPGQKIAAVAA